MKNYYEILEVDKNASDEIIKAAYKSLVKKYHPDLKEGEEKRKAEEKIKEVNEAYDTLSVAEKREEYNQTLANETISQEEYNAILNENISLKNKLEYFISRYSSPYNQNTINNSAYYTRVNPEQQQSYQTKQEQNNAYSDNYYKRPQQQYYTEAPKNKYTMNGIKNYFSESFKSLIALAFTLLVAFLAIRIPFINTIMVKLFGENFFIIIVVVLAFLYLFRNRN